jgi:glycosyltransferase involved in cell wall biosynthesis
MIVRDEEHNLEACLGPVADLFDEIIIVDTGSKDRTVEIARRFTSQVHHFPWCDDFSAARNESLRHATGDWVFWLDADDRVRPADLAPLRQLLAQLDDRPLLYMLNTIVSSLPGEEPRLVSHPRLFRMHPDLRWRGRVHEQLMPNFAEPRYERVFSRIQIEHVGYQDRVLAERKSRRKLRLLRMDYAVDPNNSSALFHLGIALVHARNYPEATRYFLRLLNQNLTQDDTCRWIYDALIDVSLLAGNLSEAAGYAERALQLFPDDEYLLYARAKTFYLSRDYQAAIPLLERAIHAPHRELLFQVTGNIKTKLAPLMLGMACRMLGDCPRAEAALQVVLHSNPADCEALFNLGLVFLDQGRRTDVVQLMQRLLESPQGASNAKLLAALCCLRHNKLDVARQLIDDVIASNPQLIRARMLRIEWLSRSYAPLEDLARAINDVLRIQPEFSEARNWLLKVRHLQAAEPPVTPQAVPSWSSSSVPLSAMPA